MSEKLKSLSNKALKDTLSLGIHLHTISIS